MPKTNSPRSKPTRLPVLKVLVDKGRSQRKDTVASPNDKEHGGILEQDSPKPTDQERERYWRKVRDRLDRDSPSPQNKEKQKANHHGAYRKIISLASSPRQEIAKHKWKHSGGSLTQKPCTPDFSPATKSNNSSPGFRVDSADSLSTDRDRFTKGQGRTNSNHSTRSGGTGSSSLKNQTDITTDSSYNSNSSVSPISGPTTSIKEWEDRFVVHMPSAREPNPPTMDVSQITEYQKSIEKVRKEGESMLDPDTLPSPRTTTPEKHLKSPDRNGNRLGMLDGQDSRPSSSTKESEGEQAYLPTNRRHYSPDEVGKHRFSTIWEDSSTGPKQKPRQANPDGSFLGCKEINGPDDRNPDEILLFSTPEQPKVVNIPSQTSRLPRESKLAAIRHMKRAPGETILVQEEWEPISQNLKHVQCSKSSPKPLCREVQCQQLGTRKSVSLQAKEYLDPTGNPTVSSENSKSDPRADDVFIITPTITRTMVTMTDLRGHFHKHPGVQEPTLRSAGEIITDARTRIPINTKVVVSPSGLDRMSQDSWENSNGPSTTSSKPANATNTPVVKHRGESRVTVTERFAEESTAIDDKPRGMRGFIRMPGIPKSSTESRIGPLPDNSPVPVVSTLAIRAGNIPPRNTKPQSPDTGHSRPTNSMSYPPPTTKSSPRLRDTKMLAKIVEVAELDGQQVDDHREDNSTTKTSRRNRDQRDNKIKPDVKGIISSETLHVIIDVVFLFVAQVQGFTHQIRGNRSSKVVLLKLLLNGILGMLEHCLHVLRKGLAVISTYNTTGGWPNTNDKDLACSLTEVGQALVYIVVLAFITVIITRTVGFVILIGAWIVWFARPFALAFRTIARVLSL
ncbi:hypothetical protein BDW59DRAFT_168709 [Aspergillus cavernicola]|uniref:NTP binding protein n=1 Tax=Aspergillus cavernicola TaxID=176166 RepID=A0ABR4J3J5_9EURO